MRTTYYIVQLTSKEIKGDRPGGLHTYYLVNSQTPQLKMTLPIVAYKNEKCIAILVVSVEELIYSESYLSVLW